VIHQHRIDHRNFVKDEAVIDPVGGQKAHPEHVQGQPAGVFPNNG
jgi:hypothetical protein